MMSIKSKQKLRLPQDHDKRFFYRVYVNDAPAGEGSGHSKKEAEQAAAGAALAALAGEDGCPDSGGQEKP